MTLMRLIFLALLICGSAAAQWLDLPTPNVPRNADGTPNLDAPAPKAADGHPDLSGMWIPKEELHCNPEERGVQCTELPLTPQLLNIAMGMEDGLPYQDWAAKVVKDRAGDVSFEDPHVHCMPPNYPRAWAFPETQKIFQMPKELVILNEFNASYRQVFMDGRALPSENPEELWPTWSGYSVAHWDGDALVIDSIGYRDDSWLDTMGNFFSSNARVTERITRPNFGTMDVEVTVDDPTVFTEPWTVMFHMKPLLDTEMLNLYCLENNKDLDHFVK